MENMLLYEKAVPPSYYSNGTSFFTDPLIIGFTLDVSKSKWGNSKKKHLSFASCCLLITD